jgi:hypothetical protein
MITASQMALRNALSPSPATATSTATHPRNTILGRECQEQSSEDPANKNEKGISRRRGLGLGLGLYPFTHSRFLLFNVNVDFMFWRSNGFFRVKMGVDVLAQILFSCMNVLFHVLSH